MKTIQVKRLTKEAIIPTRSHEYDAGLDLYCSKSIAYNPGDIIKVPTGIALNINGGYVGIIRDRSSVGSTGLKVTAGIIDAGFTGEVNICMINLTGKHGCIQAGTKIAQILVMPVALPKVEVVEEFETIDGLRGAAGWGSTNKESM